MSRLVIIIVVASLGIASTQARGQIRLEIERRTHLTFDQNRDYSRWTVCPNGTVFLGSPAGNLRAITRSGGLLSDIPLSRLGALDALACSPEGTLYAFGRDSAASFDRWFIDSSGSRRITITNPRLNSRILSAAANSRSIFVAAFLHDRPFPLHAVSLADRSIRSFGETGLAQDRAVAAGWLLWQNLSGRLLFVPPRMAEVQAYDEDGRNLWIRGFNGLRPLSVFDSGGHYALGAASMPADGLAIELSATKLLLLDRNANVLTMIETALPGTLLGTDSSRRLYFWDGAYVTSTILSR